MSTARGQMAITGIVGPMSGMATVTGRKPRPLAVVPVKSPVYWPAAVAGVIRTPSQTPAPSDTAAPIGGPCCGQ